jgi:hypothetical protein
MRDFTGQNVYILKRDYGRPIDFYKVKTEINSQTGKKKLVRTKITIDLAILLPSLEVLMGRSLAFPQSGGSVDVADRILVVDADDLPDSWRIEVDDYVIVDDRERYQIKNISDYGGALILAIKETRGAELSRMLDESIRIKLIFSQTITVSKVRLVAFNPWGISWKAWGSSWQTK